MKRPQPAFLALLASGDSPVYPCHVSPRDMRSHPIGTGPFKFVDYKPNQSLKVERNRDYWKPGRPYLEGVEYTIAKNRSTAILAFSAGKYDVTFAGTVTIPLMRDVKSQVPDAVCESPPGSVLTVYSSDAGSRTDIPKWVYKAGHRLIGVTQQDGYDEIVVEKTH